MDQDSPNPTPEPIPDPNHPLEIAAQLEHNVNQNFPVAIESSIYFEVPDDFQTALHGLDLIRRASQADRNREKEESSSKKGSTETFANARADTDRLGPFPDADGQVLESGPNRHNSGNATTIPALSELRRIGRFEILRELGRGGFGVVLLGRDPELDRLVALKVPRLEMLIDAESRQRFTREANLVSTLSHPAIVPVYEFSAGPGVPFIAFAWCCGPTLAEWLKRRSAPMDPMLAARMVSQLAGAMQYAHQREIVHRDLKPGNILLDLNDDTFTSPIDDEQLAASLRITDFGLAKSLQPATSNITRDGAIVGTPNYMAPEQVNGRVEIAPAVDIYSLGAILYELLTGQPPHKRDSDLATLRAIESEEPIRPGKLSSSVSKDLEAVCLKCLEKNPSQRYASAHALQHDLENVVAGWPITARRISKAERTIRWCRRNPLTAALASTTLLATTIALIAALFGWYSTNQAWMQEHLARMEADQAYQDAKSAVDKYFVTVSENQLLTAPGLKPLRQELLNSAVGYYSDFIEQHRDDKTLASDLIKAYLYRASIDDDLGNYPAAREGYETVWRMLEELKTEGVADQKLSQQAAAVLRKLARLDRLAGNAKTALEKTSQAVALNQDLLLAGYDPARTHGELGQLFSMQANLQLSAGQLKQSLETHLASENHFTEAADLEPENQKWEHFLAQSQGNQAHLFQQAGENVKASELFDQVSSRLSNLIERYPEHLSYQVDRGKALAARSLSQRANGKHEDGLNSLTEATRVFDRLAAIHPQTVMYQSFRSASRREIAEILNNLDRLPECETMLTESLEILSQLREKADQNRPIQQEISFVHVALGRLNQRLGRPEQAREHLQTAIAGLEQEYLLLPGNLPVGCGLAEALQQMAIVGADEADANRLLDQGQAILEALQKERPNNPLLTGMLKVNRETRQLLKQSSTR